MDTIRSGRIGGPWNKSSRSHRFKFQSPNRCKGIGDATKSVSIV